MNGPLVPHIAQQLVRSWPAHAEGGHATYMPLREVLMRSFPTDAHFAQYSVPAIPRRLSSPALGHADLPDGIAMVVAVFDVDCEKSHAALGGSPEVPAPDEWWLGELAKFDALLADHPGGYIYRTKGGYRIVYALAEPIRLRDQLDRTAWSERYVLWAAYLRRRFSIAADPSCADWTRMFRCPRATRTPENGPEQRECLGDPTEVGAWSCEPTGEDRALAASLARKRSPKVRQRVAKHGPPATAGKGVLFHALSARNQLGPELAPGKWAIECAWASEHSKGAALDGSTVLFAPPEGEELGWPHCSHAHCQHRTLRDWMALFPADEIVRAREATGLPARPTSDRIVCPSIVVDHQEHAINELASEAIGQLENVYQRAGMLVEVINDPCPITGGPRIREIPLPRVRELLVAAADWFVVKERKGQVVEVPTHPPDWCVRAVHARGDWSGTRALVGFVETPVMRPDGSVLQDAGFDDATGMLYIPNQDFPRVPDRPSPEDAIAARQVLEDPLADFNFAEPHHRAAALAALLTPFARPAFTGPAPLVGISATTPGEGKSLLADVIVLACTGRPAAKMPHTTEDEEARKAITALGLEGAACAVIDNVVHPLGSPALDNALTSISWKDRALGRSAMITVPLRMLWIATGNNLTYAGDTFRRALPILLNSGLENPETRTSFRYPNLRAHVLSVRPEIVCAALTLLRAYFVAGCPEMTGVPLSWGSFEGWARLIPHAIVWAGCVDPLKARDALEVDGSKSTLVAVMKGWERMAGAGATISMVLQKLYPSKRRDEGPPDEIELELALREALETLVPTDAGRSPDARRVGKAFQKLRGRVVEGRTMRSEPYHGAMRWRVESAAVAG